MQQEYTYNRRFRIFAYCLTAPLVLLPLGGFYGVFVEGIKTSFQAVIAVVTIVPCTALALYCFNFIPSVLTSDNDGIRYRSFWYNRTLLWKEVKGYKWKDGTLVLVPVVKGKRRLRISAERLHFDELFGWIMSRYPDLRNKITTEVIIAGYKADAVSWHERRMAEYTARIFNVSAFVLMASCLSVVIAPASFTGFMRWSPLLMMTLLAAIPVALQYHKGWLIVAENKREQVLPGILWTLMFGTAGLMSCGIAVYTLRLYLIWMAALVVTLVFTTLVYFTSRRWRISAGGKIWGIACFAVLFMPAVFGFIVYLNTFFDRSTAQIYKTAVVNKRISTGKSYSYYLVVAPWGPEKSARSISVGLKRYNETAINDTVRMALHPGALGLSWYTPLIPKR